MKQSDKTPHTRKEIVAAFENGKISSEKESRSALSVGAQLLEMKESEFNAVLDKYFDFIQAKIPKITEKDRDNFKKNLWMLFIERENVLNDQQKRWTMENIESSGYLKSMLKGFCFVMEKLIEKNGNLEQIFNSQFILDLHKRTTEEANNEGGEPLKKQSGKYCATNTTSSSSNYVLSLDYLLERLEMMPELDARSKLLSFALNNGGIFVSDSITIDNGKHCPIIKLETTHARCISEDYAQTEDGKFFINQHFSTFIDHYISKLVRKEINYQQFAWKMLNYHPFSDGNGRLFNHLLCFAHAVSQGDLPYMMWHSKSHETMTEKEWTLMKKEGQEAFRKIFLADIPLDEYVRNNDQFEEFMSLVVDPMGNFLESDEFKFIQSNKNLQRIRSDENLKLLQDTIKAFKARQQNVKFEKDEVESKNSPVPFKGSIEIVIFESIDQKLNTLNTIMSVVSGLKDKKSKNIIMAAFEDQFRIKFDSKNPQFNQNIVSSDNIYFNLKMTQKSINEARVEFNVIDLYCQIAAKKPLQMSTKYYYQDQEVETKLSTTPTQSPNRSLVVPFEQDTNRKSKCVNQCTIL